MTTEREGNIELRWAADDDFDEFVVYDDAGRCVAHGESMSDHAYWIGLYPNGETTGKTARIWINTNRGKLVVTGEWE